VFLTPEAQIKVCTIDTKQIPQPLWATQFAVFERGAPEFFSFIEQAKAEHHVTCHNHADNRPTSVVRVPDAEHDLFWYRRS
jgi:hypothetical protein